MDKKPPISNQQLLMTTFVQLRRIGFDLGLEELLDALQLLQMKAFTDRDELKEMVKLLWCKSEDQQQKLSRIWQVTIPALRNDKKRRLKERIEKELDLEKERSGTQIGPGSKRPLSNRLAEQQKKELTQEDDMAWSALPISAPMLPPADDIPELSSDWPITRRQMIYYWRYLRYPVPDGPADLLDVTATINKAANQGFYLTPVYRRRHQNHAHLLLLIDQDGSMMPFHRFTRDIVDSARFDSEIKQVDVFYYQNVPQQRVYIDPHMTEAVSLSDLFDHVATNTSIFLISDMGAARGRRKMGRIQTMTTFLLDLQERSNLLAVLNPMPRSRWQRTSAEIIADQVPMFPITADGFSNAIDVVRGITGGLSM